jgi:hypothetical protein
VKPFNGEWRQARRLSYAPSSAAAHRLTAPSTALFRLMMFDYENEDDDEDEGRLKN